MAIGTGRVVEVLHDRGAAALVDADRWVGGSGYLIGGRLVLTAAHNVDYRQDLGDDGQLLVRTIGGSEFAARVMVVGDRGSQVDLALLEVTDPRFDDHLPPVTFGQVNRDASAPVTSCWAVGFPRFAETGPVLPEGSSRETWQVRGDIEPGSKLRAGLLALLVSSAPERLPAGLAGSVWEGMSGAVVFAADSDEGELAVGVVSTHHRAEGGSALTVVPITAVAGLPAAARWWHPLGVTDLQLPVAGQQRSRLTGQLPQQQATPGRPVQLAPRSALAGREALLAELDGRLSAGDGSAPCIISLSGQGGAGKTSVAVEYAYRHLAEVGVAWQFPAGDTTVLAAGFDELAAQLGVRGLADTRDPVASVHAVLADFAAPWLLIFDNAEDMASVSPFLPKAGPGRVLITSQNPDWPQPVMDVPALGTDAAAGFLTSRTGDPDRQAARDLAGMLGGLPLALEQAAAYAQASGGLAGYLALFRQRPAELLARGQPAGYSKTVASTWALAFNRLQQTEPGAVSLLRLLAFCAPDAIPWRLLLQLPREPAKRVPRRAARMNWLGRARVPWRVARALTPLIEDPLAAGDAIKALRGYSLVTPAGDGAVSLHRLVQFVTREQMPAQLRKQWQQAAAALIEAVIPQDPARPDTWPVFAALLPHATAVLAEHSDEMEQFASYLGSSGNYRAARDLRRKVVARGWLALRTGEAGDAAAARDQFAALLPVLQRVYGPEHPDTLGGRRHLADWTGTAGDAASARDQFAALLPVLQRVYGPEHRDTLAVRGHLANGTGMAGDVAAARDQFAALLPVLERVYGPEHPDTLATRIRLALWTGAAGDAAAARDQLTELLPVLERVHGPEHPDTLDARAALAVWTGAGDAAAARDQLAALLPLLERVYGPEHPDTLHARGDLADWTGRAGDAAAARDQLTELLPVLEQIHGPDHRDTRAARGDLAGWTGRAGDVAAARDQFADLASMCDRLVGPEHPDTLAARSNLARSTGRAGDAAAARDQLTELLPVLERVHGPEHPFTLDARDALAGWTGKAGDAAAARDQLTELLPVFERVLGPEHPKTLAARSHLACWD